MTANATACCPSPANSLYERYAGLYARFRLDECPDDRRAVADALTLASAHRLAEIGCGPGAYARAFARWHPRLHVTGIDRAPAQVALARRLARRDGLRNARFTIGDARALRAPDGMYDRVVVSRLFMVLGPDRDALAEVRRILAPGGVALIAEPADTQAGFLARVRRHAAARGDFLPDPEPHAEHCFGAPAFRAFVVRGEWADVRFWEANGYRYARCDAGVDTAS